MKTIGSILLGFITAIIVIAIALCISVNSLVGQYGKNYIKTADKAPRANAIIIPGAKINSDGTPSKSLQYRLELGYQLYKQGCAPKILVSGESSKGYSEVAAMLSYLEELGVPPQDLFADHAGFSTYDTMYRAGTIFGVSNAIVVSQHYHNVRAIYIGHQLGINTVAVDAKDSETANIKWMNFREYGARLKAFLQAGIFRPEPKVLGDPVSIFSDGTVTHQQ